MAIEGPPAEGLYNVPTGYSIDQHWKGTWSKNEIDQVVSPHPKTSSSQNNEKEILADGVEGFDESNLSSNPGHL